MTPAQLNHINRWVAHEIVRDTKTPPANYCAGECYRQLLKALQVQGITIHIHRFPSETIVATLTRTHNGVTKSEEVAASPAALAVCCAVYDLFHDTEVSNG